VRQVMMCVAIGIALSAVVIGCVWGGVLPTLGGLLAGVAGTSLWFYQMRMRDWRVRRLVCTAYGADANVVSVKLLAGALGTKDVVQARTDHLGRENQRLAKNYQNGDASDY
jgi:hypothetical protein